MYPVYIREKVSTVPAYRPFPYNVFLYFLKGQVHKKESKLEIMTNVGKFHPYKHSQMSNAYANGFDRYIK